MAGPTVSVPAMGYNGSGGDSMSQNYQGVLNSDAYKSRLKQKLDPVQDWKDHLTSDWNALTKNPESLGLTDAERAKTVGAATQEATAAQNAQAAQLNQSALGGQGFQAGTFAETARGITKNTEDAAAKASAEAQALSSQMIDKEKQRILGEMDDARERTRQNTRFWLQFGVDALSGLFTAAKGGDLSSAFSNLKPDSAGDSGADTSTTA